MRDVDSKRARPPRFQFNLRIVLAIMTATAIVLAVQPSDLSMRQFALVFIITVTISSYAASIIHNAKRNPWKLPPETVTVEVDARWVRRVKSPRIFIPIAAVTGISISFDPAGLFFCGQLELPALVKMDNRAALLHNHLRRARILYAPRGRSHRTTYED